MGSRRMERDAMRVVVFDIGNVLLRWDPRNLYRKLFETSDRVEWFLSNVCDMPWNEAQDRGRSWADAVSERVARFPEWEREIRAYDNRWLEMLDGEISDNVDVLRRLKTAGTPVYAITNFSREKFAVARTEHGFLDCFDGIVVSGEVGLIKPDRQIFRHFLDRYGLAAADCVFIDDSRANTAAAAELGMSTIHYVEPMDLAEALARLGIVLSEAPSLRRRS